jgi:hypothetical protein
MKLFNAALLFALLMLPQMASANQQGFGVPRIVAYPAEYPVSKLGKVTGNECASTNDCMLGCTSSDKEKIICITAAQASNACIDPSEPFKSDTPCECLPDVKHCGFVYEKQQSDAPATSLLPTNAPKPKVTQTKPKHRPVNKTPKKTPRKSKQPTKACIPNDCRK